MIDWKRRCETLEHELGHLTDCLSHGLAAPLRAADGFSQVLLSSHAAGLEPEAQDYLQRIRSAAATMGRHIDALVRLGRVSTAPAQAQRVNLSAMAASILQERQAAAPDRQVSVSVHGELEVMGDARLLDKLMTSLLDNAWKFTRHEPAPRIELDGQVQGAEKVYRVRDNGAGFDLTQARQLFHPFGRQHTDGEFEGLGMGLAIARRVVHRHGGRIWAESAPGAGATLSFTLDELVAD